MERRRIRRNDVVIVNHKGRKFWAQVLEVPAKGSIAVAPITSNITWRACMPVEVEGVWRKLR